MEALFSIPAYQIVFTTLHSACFLYIIIMTGEVSHGLYSITTFVPPHSTYTVYENRNVTPAGTKKAGLLVAAVEAGLGLS